jgi:molybdenum cofactor guanylyltransferase
LQEVSAQGEGVMGRDDAVIGIVLAGGRGKRLGQGEKCLCRLGDRTLLERAVRRAALQTPTLLLSFNGDARQLPALGLPVLPDSVPGFAGPLAGVLAGLEYLATHHADARWLASFACDSPWFPRDLVERLRQAAERDDCAVAVARSGGRMHPVFALWSRQLVRELRDALQVHGVRKAGEFLRAQRHVGVDWPEAPCDPFFNINTSRDLELAETWLDAGEGA